MYSFKETPGLILNDHVSFAYYVDTDDMPKDNIIVEHIIKNIIPELGEFKKRESIKLPSSEPFETKFFSINDINFRITFAHPWAMCALPSIIIDCAFR